MDIAFHLPIWLYCVLALWYAFTVPAAYYCGEDKGILWAVLSIFWPVALFAMLPFMLVERYRGR